ncbi:DEAD/DEAH box helicase [Poseidonibacter ostreae]|jgi:ATP-dependent RNA helicase RhlE|uniref:DEAD/DEAH box helicase n=1 Tax=Poseidonibacter ostreae TaxID=2654171 RepID=A0ABQ6VVF4_9BACT|nr:DEAD/DEAH box helicase [Poseidonibacter ostreae]KAB7883040.1 DEAD/DEAH box helicase [Poseidonibacter ostreae]KAB7892918.1 DEAD/DEAH box helicase [Poseidonibacter ostreae]
MSFSKFNFLAPISEALTNNDYETPTKIQDKVIPLVFKKEDVLARAQTGSGKTASFVLPILNHWLNNMPLGKSKIKTLVLTPTRELTLQVADTFNKLSSSFEKELKVVSVIGGQSIGDQLLDIQKGCDVVVATPGRLLDILDKKQINLSTIDFFVVDEADKMLDLGFEEELEKILENLPEKRQNLLFSATYPPKMQKIAKKITNNPITIEIENEEPTVDLIKQRAISVNLENRSALLQKLLKENSFSKVLVFMANNRASDNIAAKFRKYGFKAESFHGNLVQEDRIFTLDEFKTSKIDILFSSDIASRGLHIDDISCVVNYDLPRSPADYIHRIGRTGRAGSEGLAISFITLENEEHFKLIEKRSNIKLQREEIEGFELIGTPLEKEKGKTPIKGKRKSKKDKLREQGLK